VSPDRHRLAPIAGLLGAEVRRSEAGRVAVDFAVREEFLISSGAVQGGIVAAYADACMAMAAHTLFEPGQSLATSSLTMSFLRPITEGPVRGEGAVMRRGRSLVFLQATLRDGRGRECARATSVGSIRKLP
jgi:uncharacterized protein (TIGR00369 family)